MTKLNDRSSGAHDRISDYVDRRMRGIVAFFEAQATNKGKIM